MGEGEGEGVGNGSHIANNSKYCKSGTLEKETGSEKTEPRVLDDMKARAFQSTHSRPRLLTLMLL
jgi:hypothetical protein